MDILALDLQSVHYEKRELILDAINQVTVHVYGCLVKKILCQISSKVKEDIVCFQKLNFYIFCFIFYQVCTIFLLISIFFLFSYSVFLI